MGPGTRQARAAGDAWTEYGKGPWDAITITDDKGRARELWVNLQDAGAKRSLGFLDRVRYGRTWVWDGWKSSGEAPLYEFKRKSSTPNPGGEGYHIVYSSLRTDFKLKLDGGGTVVRESAPNWSAAPFPEHFFQAQGTYLTAEKPTGMAPEPPAPAPVPIPRRRPAPPAKNPVAKVPTPTPRPQVPDQPAPTRGVPPPTRGLPPPTPIHPPAPAAAGAPLTRGERSWLTFSEYDDYQAAAAKTGATAAETQAAEKSAREKVAANLREPDQAGYKALTGDKIDALALSRFLDPLPLYGAKDKSEVELSTAEVQALAAVKDPQGRPLDQAYQAEMKTAAAGDLVLRHRITVKYRAQIPGAKTPQTAGPGDKPKTPGDGTGAPAGQTTLESIIRAHLDKAGQAQFDKDLAAAKTDAEKKAVLDRYLQKVASQLRTGDFNNDGDLLRKACPAILATPAPAAPKSDPAKAKTDKELAQKLDACNKDMACVSKLVDGKKSAADVVTAPAAPDLDPKLREACAIAMATPPGDSADNGQNGSGGGDVSTTIPTPGADVSTTPPDNSGDPHFWTHLKVGMNGALVGMFLASFFGGPLLMAVGAAVLGGVFYGLSHHFYHKK
jgi:hypothetical protein